MRLAPEWYFSQEGVDMNLTESQRCEIETSWHWNAHNSGECGCDEPPYKCPECGNKYPFGLLKLGGACGDCIAERKFDG